MKMFIMKLNQLYYSFKFAFSGLWYVICTQRNAQIHLIIAIIVLVIALFLNLGIIQWAILILTIIVIFSAEMFNTAIEVLVDLVSPEFHPLAKIAKDIAAGAVLLLAIGAVVIGLLILGPPLLKFLE